jgi:8-oxo-dGTP diphosphatase
MAVAPVVSSLKRLMMDDIAITASASLAIVPFFWQSDLKSSLNRTTIMTKISTLIPVVALALLAADGRVLLQRRKFGAMHGGLWEFPGGKVKPEESLESALVREIREELGIALDPADCAPLCFASDPALPPAPREPYVVLLYICRKWQGEPLCLDGEAIVWFRLDDLAGLAMPPLDVPLVEALRRSI